MYTSLLDQLQLCNAADGYSGYVNSSRNIEVGKMLEAMRKYVFIKGKQESVNVVLAFVATIIVYSRFWVKISKEEDNPYIIEILIEIADYLSSAEHTSFDNKHKHNAKYT